MSLLGRRRVLWDYLRGALWVLPSVSIASFLVAGVVLSRVVISDIGRETRHVIDDLYPDELRVLEPEERCPDPPGGATVVWLSAPATSRPSSPRCWWRRPRVTTLWCGW
jgi:hypothetical protein